jgi:nicotinamidase-related amidase
MPIPRLRIEDAALLVIDMQEKLLPSISGKERIIRNCEIMLRLAGELGIPYLVTEHYPQGLGRTVDAIASAMIDPAARIEKTRFSAAVEIVVDLLQSWRRTSVLLCGIEAQVCIMQTALDLQAAGRQCFIVSDAIAATQPDQIAPALRRMEAGGAVTTGVMSAMYELLGDARHPSRRACVELAKRIAR